MAIPDYQTLMLPLLEMISDGELHTTQEAVEKLANQFNLTEEELNHWLPSKRARTFHNRVHWAKAHLKMAGAVENISKGNFRLTERGKSILARKPSAISAKYLMNLFPDYQDMVNTFRRKKK